MFQRDVKAARGVHEDLSNVGQFAFSFLEPHDHAEMFLSFPQFGGGPAAKSGLNHVLDVQYVKPIAGGAGPIDFDLQLRYLAAAVNKSPRHSSHWGNGVQDPFRLLLQDATVLAKHFDHNLPVDLGDALQHVVADGLRKARFDARNDGQRLVHLFNELFASDLAGPFPRRFQIHKNFRHVHQLGISSVFWPAGFGDDRPYFRKLTQDFAHARQLQGRFAHRKAWRQIDVNPNRSFI